MNKKELWNLVNFKSILERNANVPIFWSSNIGYLYEIINNINYFKCDQFIFITDLDSIEFSIYHFIKNDKLLLQICYINSNIINNNKTTLHLESFLFEERNIHFVNNAHNNSNNNNSNSYDNNNNNKSVLLDNLKSIFSKNWFQYTNTEYIGIDLQQIHIISDWCDIVRFLLSQHNLKIEKSSETEFLCPCSMKKLKKNSFNTHFGDTHQKVILELNSSLSNAKLIKGTIFLENNYGNNFKSSNLKKAYEDLAFLVDLNSIKDELKLLLKTKNDITNDLLKFDIFQRKLTYNLIDVLFFLNKEILKDLWKKNVILLPCYHHDFIFNNPELKGGEFFFGVIEYENDYFPYIAMKKHELKNIKVIYFYSTNKMDDMTWFRDKIWLKLIGCNIFVHKSKIKLQELKCNFKQDRDLNDSGIFSSLVIQNIIDECIDTTTNFNSTIFNLIAEKIANLEIDENTFKQGRLGLAKRIDEAYSEIQGNYSNDNNEENNNNYVIDYNEEDNNNNYNNNNKRLKLIHSNYNTINSQQTQFVNEHLNIDEIDQQQQEQHFHQNFNNGENEEPMEISYNRLTELLIRNYKSNKPEYLELIKTEQSYEEIRVDKYYSNDDFYANIFEIHLFNKLSKDLLDRIVKVHNLSIVEILNRIQGCIKEDMVDLKMLINEINLTKKKVKDTNSFKSVSTHVRDLQKEDSKILHLAEQKERMSGINNEIKDTNIQNLLNRFEKKGEKIEQIWIEEVKIEPESNFNIFFINPLMLLVNFLYRKYQHVITSKSENTPDRSTYYTNNKKIFDQLTNIGQKVVNIILFIDGFSPNVFQKVSSSFIGIYLLVANCERAFNNSSYSRFIISVYKKKVFSKHQKEEKDKENANIQEYLYQIFKSLVPFFRNPNNFLKVHSLNYQLKFDGMVLDRAAVGEITGCKCWSSEDPCSKCKIKTKKFIGDINDDDGNQPKINLSDLHHIPSIKFNDELKTIEIENMDKKVQGKDDGSLKFDNTFSKAINHDYFFDIFEDILHQEYIGTNKVLMKSIQKEFEEIHSSINLQLAKFQIDGVRSFKIQDLKKLTGFEIKEIILSGVLLTSIYLAKRTGYNEKQKIVLQNLIDTQILFIFIHSEAFNSPDHLFNDLKCFYDLAIKQRTSLKQIYEVVNQKDYSKQSYSIKFHMIFHMMETILERGNPIGYSTHLFEKLHQISKRFIKHQSNYKSLSKSIAKHNLLQIAHNFNCNIIINYQYNKTIYYNQHSVTKVIDYFIFKKKKFTKNTFIEYFKSNTFHIGEIKDIYLENGKLMLKLYEYIDNENHIFSTDEVIQYIEVFDMSKKLYITKNTNNKLQVITNSLNPIVGASILVVEKYKKSMFPPIQ